MKSLIKVALTLFMGLLGFGTAAQGIDICGAISSCPEGLHPVEVACDAQCGSCTSKNLRVTCQPDTVPTFTQCFAQGMECPTGYHVREFGFSTACEYPFPQVGPIPGDDMVCEVDTPLLDQVGAEGSSCADLGVAHPSPGYLMKWTVTARPGAQIYKYSRHAGCSSNQWFIEGPFTVPSSGTFTRKLANNSAHTDCDELNLGRWESFVVVDGKQSASDFFTYYNSSCSGTSTCSKAGSFCPSGF